MSWVFDVADVADLPVPGGRGVVLTARADLDIAAEGAARAQIAEVLGAPVDVVLLDLTLAFVGAPAVRCVGDAAELVPAVVVVGAPRWLVERVAAAGIRPVLFARTAREALAVLRAATRDPSPPVEGVHDPRPSSER